MLIPTRQLRYEYLYAHSDWCVPHTSLSPSPHASSQTAPYASPLEAAAHQGHIHVVVRLLKGGANINYQDKVSHTCYTMGVQCCPSHAYVELYIFMSGICRACSCPVDVTVAQFCFRIVELHLQ